MGGVIQMIENSRDCEDMITQAS
ncbi:hypothetical protein [Nonomuraea basaltis]